MKKFGEVSWIYSLIGDGGNGHPLAGIIKIKYLLLLLLLISLLLHHTIIIILLLLY
jgi:hypothetical protein